VQPVVASRAGGVASRSHLARLSYRPMSTSSTSSNFGVLFDAALEKYTEQTGKDLRNHPLVHRIDTCDTAASLLAVFQEQAQKFDEFRNGDHRLINWLQPIANRLHALSTSTTLSQAVSGVSPYRAGLLFFCFFFDVLNIMQAFPPATAIFTGINVLLSVRSYASTLLPDSLSDIVIYITRQLSL
jgi:hypothetical protein